MIVIHEESPGEEKNKMETGFTGLIGIVQGLCNGGKPE